MHKLERDLYNSVSEILNWALSNKHRQEKCILTGKRLESKLDFQPSVKFSDHELVGNVSSATQLGLDSDSHLSFR